MNAGWIGGIVGTTIGLAGAVIGTYFSIRNTNGPRERTFMIRACVAFWVVSAGFLALMLSMPGPYRYLLWVPCAILLPLGIVYGNRAQQRIRREEARDPDASSTD